VWLDQAVDPAYAARLGELAVAAATGVGDDLRAAFRSRPPVSFKEDRHDPVTVHDQAAEDRIRDIILAGEPDSTILGEEGGSAGTGAVQWYVDPIDGTANFVHGLPFFCTSVAAEVDGEVVAAAVYDPLRDDLFTANGGGAWCNGTRLSSRGAAVETAALLLTGYPGSGELAADRERALARTAELITLYATVRRPGSTVLALAHVAAGWSDAALGLSVSPWDLAAGSLLVRRAGGHFLGLRRTDAPAARPWHGPGYLATVGTLEPSGSVVLALFADTHTAQPA
jgi:myo-inositol-1(or 4)-monophosphatase